MRLKNLKLIGIHIKKTAGRSFRDLLMVQYPGGYHRINIPPNQENRTEECRRLFAAIPPTTQVIHGHFHYRDIAELVQDNPEVPLITWLREPVQRVLSEFYFTKMKFATGRTQKEIMIDQMSVVDFAEKKSKSEPMAYVLDGIDLNDLAFVGIFEHLDEDLAYLAELLGWKKYEIPQVNVNKAFKEMFAPPTEDEIARIRALYQRDVDLYHHALDLRQKRIEQGQLGRKKDWRR